MPATALVELKDLLMLSNFIFSRTSSLFLWEFSSHPLSLSLSLSLSLNFISSIIRLTCVCACVYLSSLSIFPHLSSSLSLSSLSLYISSVCVSVCVCVCVCISLSSFSPFPSSFSQPLSPYLSIYLQFITSRRRSLSFKKLNKYTYICKYLSFDESPPPPPPSNIKLEI